MSIWELIAEKLRSERREFNYYFADLHPALSNTKVGFRLLQADSGLAPWQLLNSLSMDGTEILFSGEISTLEADGTPSVSQLEARNKIEEISNKCSELSPHITPRAWILTDFDIKYSIHVSEKGGISIDGSPFYYKWGDTPETQMNEARPLEFENCTKELKSNAHLFRQVSDNVWDVTLNVARWSAFLRLLKDKNNKAFNALYEATEPKGKEFTTQRFWPKDGKF
jgi:hypothetical protein